MTFFLGFPSLYLLDINHFPQSKVHHNHVHFNFIMCLFDWWFLVHFNPTPILFVCVCMCSAFRVTHFYILNPMSFSHKLGPNPIGLVSLQDEEETQECLCTEKRPLEEAETVALHDLGSEGSPETSPASPLITHIQPPVSEKINVCCLNDLLCGILLWLPSRLIQYSYYIYLTKDISRIYVKK